MAKNNDRLMDNQKPGGVKNRLTWRHGGHIDVKNNEWWYFWCTKKMLYAQWYWSLFSCKNFLLFQKNCIATDDVSENDL